MAPMMISLTTPCNATEEVEALVLKVRDLTKTIILKDDQISKARVDSLRLELLRASDVRELTLQNEWLKGELPKWYEKPAFVVPVAVLVTVWAVLRMITLSI